MIAYSRTLFLLTAAAVLAGCSNSSRVKFETSKGDFVVQINKEWAPLGAARFIELVRSGFYDNARFFRVIPRIHGAVWDRGRSECSGEVARSGNSGRSGDAK
jgi:hypothetical protein